MEHTTGRCACIRGTETRFQPNLDTPFTISSMLHLKFNRKRPPFLGGLFFIQIIIFPKANALFGMSDPRETSGFNTSTDVGILLTLAWNSPGTSVAMLSERKTTSLFFNFPAIIRPTTQEERCCTMLYRVVQSKYYFVAFFFDRPYLLSYPSWALRFLRFIVSWQYRGSACK